MYYDVFKNGEFDPMESPEAQKTLGEIARDIHKPKLDKFVAELHKKYGTNSKEHGILKGYIVLREKIK